MKTATAGRGRTRRSLPKYLHGLFWDCDPSELAWPKDRDFIARRVLCEGGWREADWLRRRLGGLDLRDWLLRTKGRGLSPRRLRFWALITDLPQREVDAWLNDPARIPWDRRRQP
jgi:hypothetical protein